MPTHHCPSLECQMSGHRLPMAPAATHSDRDGSEPWPIVEDPNVPPTMYGVIGDWSQLRAPAGLPLHEQADRDGDNVPSEAGELMARLSYADLEAIVERAEKAEAEVETLRIVISVYQGGSAELRATIVRARELAERWDAEADAYEDERPAAARAVLYCSRELLATLRGHVCAECTDCLHDGNKCCGCYDGACCQRAPDQQNAPRRLTYDTGHHEVTTHDKMRAEVGGLRAELARVEALADEDTHHLRSGVVGMVRLSDLAAALRGPAPTEEPS